MLALAKPLTDLRVRPWSVWQRHAVTLALLWAALLVLFARDTSAMVLIWWDASTFNHCLLMVPIIAWLVVQRAPLLAQLTPVAWWPAAVPALGFGLLWLIGDAAGVALLRQLALIGVLQSAVLGVLGPQVARGLVFPLAYMWLLVPMGEEFVPALQTITAKMSMVLLDWAGIPAHIEGVFITTPGGYFEVAEACSGVKFLIAMVAYAVLVANLCFKAWHRRAVFMAFALAVPIVANGIRAFGTIWIAEHHGIEFATGFDHIFYGWIFFGIVILLVMLAAWRFFDRPADDPPFDPAAIPATRRFIAPLPIMTAGLLGAALLPVIWSSLASARSGELPQQLALTPPQQWREVSNASGYPWQPRYDGADRMIVKRFRHVNGGTVDVAIAAFAAQAEGREVAAYGQGAIDPDSEWAWTASAASIAGSRTDRIVAPGPVMREAALWHRLNGITTASGLETKLLTLQSRLLGGDPRAVAVIVSAEDYRGHPAHQVISDFVRDAGGVDKMADRAVETR